MREQQWSRIIRATLDVAIKTDRVSNDVTLIGYAHFLRLGLGLGLDLIHVNILGLQVRALVDAIKRHLVI